MASCCCLSCRPDPWRVSRPRPMSLAGLAEAGLMSFLISQSAASVGECEVAMTRAVELLSCWLRFWLPGGPLSRDIRQSLMRLLTTCGPLEAPWGRAGAREVVRAVLCDQALTRMEMDAGGGHHPGQCHHVYTAEMSTSCSGDANNRVSQTLLALQVRRLVTTERSGLEELIVTQVDQTSFEPLTRLLLHPKVSDGPVISSDRLPFTIGPGDARPHYLDYPLITPCLTVHNV